MQVRKRLFESMSDLAAVADAPFVCKDNIGHNYFRNRGDDSNWICEDRPILDQAGVAKHLRDQLFAPGVERIERLSAGLSAPAPRSRRRKAYQSDQGDELDMQRLWQGDLDRAWRNTRREHTVGPSRVLIVIDVCAHGGLRAEKLALRGAAALALASSLNEAGYVLGISGAVNTRDDYAESRYSAEVRLLTPDSELDIHKLASLVASGLLFRGVLMADQVKTCPSSIGAGVGYVDTLADDTVDATGYDYVATISNSEINYPHEAQAWLTKHMSALQPEVT